MTTIKKVPKILFIAILLNMTLFSISSCSDNDPAEVIAGDEETEEEVIDDTDFEDDMVAFVFDAKGMLGSFTMEGTRFKRINP